MFGRGAGGVRQPPGPWPAEDLTRLSRRSSKANLVSWRHNAGHPDNQAEVGTWLTAPAPEALALQRPAARKIVARGDRTGDGVRDF